MNKTKCSDRYLSYLPLPSNERNNSREEVTNSRRRPATTDLQRAVQWTLPVNTCSTRPAGPQPYLSWLEEGGAEQEANMK